MQIAASSTTLTAPARATARPDLDFRSIALNRANRDDEEGSPYIEYKTTDQIVGALEGYATLKDALSTASAHTMGPAVGAAAILDAGGRFFVQEASSWSYFVDGPWQDMPNVDPIDIESPGAPAPDYFTFRDPSPQIKVQALVDGDVVVQASLQR